MLGRGVGFFCLGILLVYGPAMADVMQPPEMLAVELGGGDDRVTISAQNVTDATPSAAAVGRHADGIGASGRQSSAPSIKAETGFDPIANRSERLHFLFNQPAARVQLELTYFFADEALAGETVLHEQGGWRAYTGSRLIEQGKFVSTASDGAYRLLIVTRLPFDHLEIFATPYVNDQGKELQPGKITTDSSDFLVKRLSYQPALIAHTSITR